MKRVVGSPKHVRLATARGDRQSAASRSIADPLRGRLLRVPAFGGSLHLTYPRFALASLTCLGLPSCPILAELEHIRNHPIRTHTILIDDVRSFGKAAHNYIRIDDLIRRLLEINPNYQISYEDGWVKNDILLAKI